MKALKPSSKPSSPTKAAQLGPLVQAPLELGEAGEVGQGRDVVPQADSVLETGEPARIPGPWFPGALRSPRFLTLPERGAWLADAVPPALASAGGTLYQAVTLPGQAISR